MTKKDTNASYYQTHRADIDARNRAWREANRETYREQQREYRRNRDAAIRAEALVAYGGCCAACGKVGQLSYGKPDSLHLDHINGDGAAHRKALGNPRLSGVKFYQLLKREGWPRYVQLLCELCHEAKTRKEQGWDR